MPKALEEKPEIFEDVEYCFNGFMILSGSRLKWSSYIPISEINFYCDLYDIEDRIFFLKAIRSMDAEYLRLALDKHRIEVERNKNGNRNS